MLPPRRQQEFTGKQIAYDFGVTESKESSDFERDADGTFRIGTKFVARTLADQQTSKSVTLTGGVRTAEDENARMFHDVTNGPPSTSAAAKSVEQLKKEGEAIEREVQRRYARIAEVDKRWVLPSPECLLRHIIFFFKIYITSTF